jgi:hypothetical protein
MRGGQQVRGGLGRGVGGAHKSVGELRLAVMKNGRRAKEVGR